MKVLLAYDGSASAEAAVTELIQVRKGEGVDVRIVNVVQPALVAVPPQMAPGYAPELEEEKAKARSILDGVATRLRVAGYRAEIVVRQGEIRKTILDMAEEWNADLIMLGSHGYGQVKRFWLGSVAEYVARHADCSVEIVRGRAA